MPTKRIYAVPVEFTVQASVFVVADSPDAAIRAVEHGVLDLSGLYSFNDESVWTEDVERIKITDVTNERFVEGEAPKPVPPDEYDPTDHPDWTEGEPV